LHFEAGRDILSAVSGHIGFAGPPGLRRRQWAEAAFKGREPNRFWGRMPSHSLDLSQAWITLGKIALAYLLTLPVGWQREREAHSVGVRTFPIVAMASCGYLLIAFPGDAAAQSRVLQGLITGIGFVGGGAILKEGATVKGTATAASIWCTGVVGAAVAMGHYEIAVILSVLNLVTLRVLWRVKQQIDTRDEPRRPQDAREGRRGPPPA
jgi:putative Mg2+ transporter-C (MgtC) family protein